MMHSPNGENFSPGAPGSGRKLKEGTTNVRGKMNDSGSEGILADHVGNGTPHNEMVAMLYDWVYRNGSPDEGNNPGLDYLQRLQSRLSQDQHVLVETKSLGWIHIEIYEGRWRPGRYIN